MGEHRRLCGTGHEQRTIDAEVTDRTGDRPHPHRPVKPARPRGEGQPTTDEVRPGDSDDADPTGPAVATLHTRGHALAEHAPAARRRRPVRVDGPALATHAERSTLTPYGLGHQVERPGTRRKAGV